MDKKNKISDRRQRLKRKNEVKRLSIVFGSFCIIIVAFVIITNFTKTSTKTKKAEQNVASESDATLDLNESNPKDEGSDKETPQNVEITISAAGDCTLGTDDSFNQSTSFDAMYDSVADPSYFFSNVKPIFESDDLTIVNLEGPLTTSTDIQEKTFAFHGRPEYTQILTEGSIEAVDVANNHSYDYGQQGYDDTLNNLSNAGVTSFGYDQTAIMNIKDVKIGLVGIYTLADSQKSAEQVPTLIESVKNDGAQIIIVSFHWGVERENYPTETQINLAHSAIDNGADLVLGHHPHVLQGVENYKGKYIAYSLGNFCFGGNSNPSDKDTMIFQQTFTIENGELLTDDNIQIIPCSISSTNSRNNYQPTPAENEEKQRIEEKINAFSEGL